MLYLKKKTYPFLHLHSGNVIINQNKAILVDYENSLFNLKPYHYNFVQNIAPEVQSFGLLLFEMLTGESTEHLIPSEVVDKQNFIESKNVAIKNVISSIFKEDTAPSIENLIKMEPFSGVSVQEIPKVKLSQNTSDFLVFVTNGNNKIVDNFIQTREEEKKMEEEENEKFAKEMNKSQKSMRMPGSHFYFFVFFCFFFFIFFFKGTKKKKKKTQKTTKTKESVTSPRPKESSSSTSQQTTSSSSSTTSSNIPPPPPPPIPPSITTNNNPPVITTSNSSSESSSSMPPPPPPPPKVELPKPQQGRGALLDSIRSADPKKLLKKTKQNK